LDVCWIEPLDTEVQKVPTSFLILDSVRCLHRRTEYVLGTTTLDHVHWQ
jgi:hypothetical protein